MIANFRALLGQRYLHLNNIELSVSSLTANYHFLNSLNPNIAVAPVLKSNAYGHGLVEIAKVMDHWGVPFFCVDSLYEAYELLKAGIKSNILVMGYIHPQSLKTKRLPFSFAVFSEEMLEAVSQYQPQAPVHVFVDTGMHREGVPMSELDKFLEKALSLKLKIEGIMSHLGAAGEPNKKETREQVRNFESALQLAAHKGITPKWQHLLASEGLFNNQQLKGNLGNVARTGISLYGIDQQNTKRKLKPVLCLNSTVALIKELHPGESTGYDFTFKARRRMRLALLPIGYNDGVDRRLSNVGRVSVGRKLCPIVGRVSMNMTMVDITKALEVQVGSRVTLYAANPKAKNSIQNVAALLNTIPYELLIHLHPTTKRSLLP